MRFSSARTRITVALQDLQLVQARDQRGAEHPLAAGEQGGPAGQQLVALGVARHGGGPSANASCRRADQRALAAAQRPGSPPGTARRSARRGTIAVRRSNRLSCSTQCSAHSPSIAADASSREPGPDKRKGPADEMPAVTQHRGAREQQHQRARRRPARRSAGPARSRSRTGRSAAADRAGRPTSDRPPSARKPGSARHIRERAAAASRQRAANSDRRDRQKPREAPIRPRQRRKAGEVRAPPLSASSCRPRAGGLARAGPGRVATGTGCGRPPASP